MIVMTGLLCVFGWLILRNDAQTQTQEVEAEVDRRATAARSLIYYDENEEVQIDGLLSDEAIDGRPQVYAITLEEGLIFGPDVPDFDVDLDELVAEAIGQDEAVKRSDTDRSGNPVIVVARVFYQDFTDDIAGAVVVTGDPAGAEPSGLRPLIFGGIPIVLTLVGAGLWLLISQTIAPAEKALDRQERFVANAAHELRRPLTAIRANAESAIHAGASNPALARNVSLVDDASEMVDNLLILAELDGQGGSVELAPLRLDQLAEVIVDDMVEDRHINPSQIALTANVPVVINGNATLLGQAISNLVGNALTHGAAPIEVRVESNRLVIGDSGAGFEPDLAERAFGRFESSGGSSGSGLGLAIVATVANAHGAVAEVGRSPLGGGQVTLHF